MPPLTLDGTNGVSAVQAGAVESGDLPAGSVIQVVQGTSTGFDGTTSTSFQSSSLSASITPKLTTNKIFVSCSFNIFSDSGTEAFATLFRDSTNLASGSENGFSFTTVIGQQTRVHPCIQFLDSPNSTTSVSYSLRYKSGSGGAVDLRSDIVESVITLMEIAG